jgi:hypothetical protein
MRLVQIGPIRLPLFTDEFIHIVSRHLAGYDLDQPYSVHDNYNNNCVRALREAFKIVNCLWCCN